MTTIAMFNLSCTVSNFFLAAFIKRAQESQEEVPWSSSHDILRFLTVTHVRVFRSVSCRVLLITSFCTVIRVIRQPDNINAVPFASYRK